jgi:hypothetical protein
MFKLPKTSARVGRLACLLVAAVIMAGLLYFIPGSLRSGAAFRPALRQSALRHTLLSQNFPMAPDVNIGTDWLNTKKPLSLGDLKGRIVLLDFWTLC